MTFILFVSCKKDENIDNCLDDYVSSDWHFIMNSNSFDGSVVLVNDTTLMISFGSFKEEVITTCPSGMLYNRWSIGNHGFVEISGTISSDKLSLIRYIDPFAGIGISTDTIVGNR